MSPASPEAANVQRLEELSDAHVVQLRAMYAREYWSKGRTPDDVRRMLEHTDVVVALVDPDTDELVALARVLSDEVYKALVFDVIVRGSHRGLGVGRLLMEAVLTHPRVRPARQAELYCMSSATEFYAKWGFEPAPEGLQLLVRRAERI